MFGISPGSLLVILVIVLLIFGGKRLRTLGGDLGTAIKGFKKAMNEDDDSADKKNHDEKLIAEKPEDKSEQK